MLQSQFETMLAPDSCVVIGMFRSPRLSRKILHMFSGNHSRIVLQDIVLKESQKVLGISKEEIIGKIRAILKKEVFVFATTEEMEKRSREIVQKYGISHYPDSVILAAASANSWTILSLDRNLLRTADFEGILAFNPMRVGGT